MPRILPGETDLYALTDSRLSRGRPLRAVALELLKAGIKILQYREKALPARQMLAQCRLLRELTREFGACFIVNDHIDVALLAGADGVHIGQDDLPAEEVRRLVGADRIIGLSTHSPDQALAAARAGVDYIGVGPIFATATKADVVPPVGFAYLDWAAAHSPVPFVAIGGIKIHNIGAVARHGARCCALVSEFVGAADIGKTVCEARAAMRNA